MIYRFEEVTSTQDVLRGLVNDGQAKQGDVVMAGGQTAGRGRHGREFFSPRGSGLYMSMALPYREDQLLTPSAAVAVIEGIGAVTGKSLKAKWVNDIYMDGRKIAGILAEAFNMDAASSSRNEKPDTVLIGIGMNVRARDGGFPEELKEKAGVLLTDTDIRMLEQDYEHICGALADAIISKLSALAAASPAHILDLYMATLINPEDIPSDTREHLEKLRRGL